VFHFLPSHPLRRINFNKDLRESLTLLPSPTPFYKGSFYKVIRQDLAGSFGKIMQGVFRTLCMIVQVVWMNSDVGHFVFAIAFSACGAPQNVPGGGGLPKRVPTDALTNFSLAATKLVAFFFPAGLVVSTQYEIPFKLSISTVHVSVMAITPAMASHKVRHPSW
jgi:hypothetical protein